MFEYLVIGAAAIVGLVVGGIVSRAMSKKILEKARQKALGIESDGRRTVAGVRQRGETKAREESLTLRKESENQERQCIEENTLLEELLRKMDDRCNRREAEHAKRQAEIDRRQASVLQLKSEAKAVRQEAKEKRLSYRVGLEEKACETEAQIQARITDMLVEETRAQGADLLRNIEGNQKEELDRQAKRILGIAMGRYGGHLIIERTSSVLSLPEGGLDKLTGPDNYLHQIEEQTGTRLSLSDSGDSLRIEGSSGMEREMARRAVTRFVSEAKIRDPGRLLKSIASDLEREVMDLGKKAFDRLGLKPAHPEIVNLVGRLNYRTSYTQNQYMHAIEAGFMAGMMAAELDLDVKLARRATLLHDIGKALTHEVEGSHAVIGADYARRYGEEEVVANAIGSHHGDEPPASPYAFIVAAADAMSGGRPGARREMVETYVDRIADLERIATDFPGVVEVHAVQAGRELRVHVNEQKVTDQQAAALSEKIAAKIAEELTFPGQIRVTVIREFKAVEMAS